jgi:hypothetical protein
MEAILSSETPVLTRATRRHISEDGILHSPRRENLTFLYVDDVCTSQETPLSLHGLLRGKLYFLYVDVRTSQETYLWASTACYEDSFTFLYVDKVSTSQETPLSLHGLLRGELYFLYVDVRTSQETYLWASAACYGDSFTSLLCYFMVGTRQLVHKY